MAILITGGAGFIGSNFIAYFLNQNKEQLLKLAPPLLKSGYGEYLQQLV